jgi:DNA mismatch repair protein MutL
VRVEEAAGRPGTRVTVRDVLAGLPARRKFLGDAHREGLRCVEVVMRLAAGHPCIAFRLEMDGRLVLSTPGDGRLLETLVALYGPATVRSLISLGPPEEPYPPGVVSLAGYVGGPATFRSRRTDQSVYVNRRVVRAPALLGAVEAAYGPLLPAGSHPFVILLLDVEPSSVDVNVHPTKAEVRLQREQAVRSFLGHLVKRALARADLARPLLDGPSGGEEATAAGPLPASREGVSVITPLVEEHGVGPAPASREAVRVGQAGPMWDFQISRLRVIGQAMGTYLLAEGPEGLYVVDQHAAHERVYYETMDFPHESQLLLVPLVIRIGGREREVLGAFAEEVRRAGFEVESWEGDAVALRAVPPWAAGQEEACLRGLLEELEEPVRGEVGVHVRRAAAACRAAVRASFPLGEAEAQALLDQLSRCENPWVCPHGRPTVLKVTRADLERHFGRR